MLFETRHSTNFVSGMLIGVLAGSAAATVAIVGTDKRKMKKIKASATKVVHQISDKIDSVM